MTKMWHWGELRFLNLLGVCPYVCKTEKWRTFSEMYGKFQRPLYVFLYLPLFLIFFVNLQTGTIDKILMSLAIGNLGFQGFIKLNLFLFKRTEVEYLIKKVDDLQKLIRQEFDFPAEVEKVSKLDYFLCRCIQVYIGFGCTSTIIWLLIPAISQIQGRNELMVDGYYPWNIDTFIGWLLAYLSQVHYSALCTISIMGTDALCCVLLIQLHNLNTKLISALENVEYIPEKKGGQKVPTLNFCLKFHQEILMLQDVVNDFIRFPIFLSVLSATLSIFLSTFIFTSLDQKDVRNQNMVEISFGQMCEMILFCYLSQRVQDQNETIMRAAYNTNWYLGDRSDINSLLILIEMSKRTHSFGIIVYANYQTLIAVLQSVFSYYNFLTAVYEN
nr:olfactory receptor 53 [Tropidothorax elegans]